MASTSSGMETGDGPGAGGGPVLRKNLSQLLDDACQFLFKSTNISKQFQDDTIQHKLLLKQEQAKRECKALVDGLAKKLPDLYKALDQEVTNAVLKKEEQLQQEYDLILDSMKQVVKDCNIIESMLEESDHKQLADDAPQLINHLRKTMMYDPEENLRSVLSLEYVPDMQKINSYFRETSKFGYIKSSLFEVEEAKLVNCQNKAFKNNEDILCLKISAKHVKLCKEFVRSFIATPRGTELTVSMEDNQDGTMTLKYTPEVTGVHYLHVLMYNAHIPGSPFMIDVLEMATPEAEQPATTLDGKRKQEGRSWAVTNKVKRSFLCELTRHITDQPPPPPPPATPTTAASPKANRQRRNSAEDNRGSRDRNNKQPTPEKQRGDKGNNRGPSRIAEGTSPQQNRFRSYTQNRTDNTRTMDKRSDNKSWRSGKDLKQDEDRRKPSQAASGEGGMGEEVWILDDDDAAGKKTVNGRVDTTDAPCDVRPKTSSAPSTWVKTESKNTETSSKVARSNNVQKNLLCRSKVIKPAAVETFFDKSALQFDPNEEAAEGTSTEKKLTVPNMMSVMQKKDSPWTPMHTHFLRSPTCRARRSGSDHDLNSKTAAASNPTKTSERPRSSDGLSSWPAVKEEPKDSYTAISAPETTAAAGVIVKSESVPLMAPTFEVAPSDTPPVSKKKPGYYREEGPASQQALAPNVLVKQEVNEEVIASAPSRNNNTWKPDVNNIWKPDVNNIWKPDVNNIWEPEVKVEKPSPTVSQAVDIPSVQPSVAIDDLNTYPPPWKATGKLNDVVAKHIAKGDIVEGLNCHPHVQHIAGRNAGIKFPIGVTVNKVTKDIIVTNQGLNTVLMFDWNNSQPKVSLGEGKDGVTFDRPSAVVTDEQGIIYVKDDKSIFTFTQEGKHIKRFGEKVLGKPYGLTLTPEGRLLTIDTKKRAIIVFDRDGENHVEHRFEPCYKGSQGSKIRFLAVHGTMLVACDLGLSVFYVSTTTGGDYEELGSYGRDYGEFNEPSGVTMDRYGNMLIADSKNDRIHIYDRAGNFHGFINLPTRIRRPSDIHLTEDSSHLLVSNLLGHSIAIFKLITT